MTGPAMEARALLARLAALGVEVFADGDRLLCRGARRQITRELHAELAARKSEIIEHLRRSAAPTGEAPLSYAQQRLWFLDQMQPGTTAYVLSMAQHLRGALNMEALHVALTELVRRHEILRTIFPLVDGAPVQRVMARCEVDLAVIDLAHVSTDVRDAEARRLAGIEIAQPFDLASDRLLRVRVYVLGAQSHVFVLALHHMVADGWSVALIARELATLYAAAAAGATPPASEPATQYASYARWQREASSSQSLAGELSYWTSALSDAPRVLALPTDRIRPPIPSYRGGRVEFQIDAGLTSALRDISRQAGASPFMLLLAAMGLLLARHARQNLLVIGAPIAGRNQAEWASIVGCFVNTLALRVDLTGDPSFMELLRRVRDVALDAFDHQDLPFERLVEALRPDRDLSRNPVVQVSLGLHNAPGQTPLATLPLPGLEASPIDVDPGNVRFDLELDVWEVSGGLHARLLYASDLFDASTAAGIASQLRVLLAEIASNPQRAVSRIPMMTANECRDVTTRWNPAIAVASRGRLLHELVSEQAARFADAVAIVSGDTQLRYSELMVRVRALARAIRRCGVKRGDSVGLCVGRGPSAVVGMLAILENDAAYLPIDPEHPPARSALVLEDSGARVIVTEPQLQDRFAGGPLQIVRIGIDDVDLPATQERAEADRGDRASESLAYVMYTSGSTGRPKGVAVPHRAVVGLLDAMHRVLPLGAADVFLAVTTFGFDISVLEIFLPLMCGAQLVIAQRDETLDGKRLAAAIAERGVTAMQATPATWNMLIDSGWRGAPRMLALCGGEPLAPALAAALRERCGRVWNVYGPTETTIWSSADEVRDDAAVTIGYPLANTAVHVLDRHLDTLPCGMVGEIWIGGEGVSRGYLGRAGLTAAAFLPDPFTPDTGARMYRTGDLGRRLQDGRIECLGRIDQQVKFRGFRIEPADIEAALLTHDSVAQAVVVLRGVGFADQRLLAYLVAAPDRVLNVENVRRHVQDMLPAYLVPTGFEVLDALPTTPNGKIDRAALPAPSVITPLAATTSMPATEVERKLADIWAAVLQLDRVGVDDSFFDLGGHSLLLARVRAEVALRLGRDVAVVDLFQYPTIRTLAGYLSGEGGLPSNQGATESAARQVAAFGRLAQAAEQIRVRNV